MNLVQYSPVKPQFHRISFGVSVATTRTVGRAAPSAPSTDTLEYAYQYDDIGNRITSTDLGTNRTYTANSFNQYTLISNLCDSASLREEFVPQFDDDGNQTLIQTSTGVWSVTYNGENRPVLWTGGTQSATTNIVMSFDRMGRRVEYLETAGGSQSSATETNAYHRFVYDNYLCIQRLDAANGNAVDLAFVWDVTEPIATRPLIVDKPEVCMACVTHDGNKNVIGLLPMSVELELVAHYRYDPFGCEKRSPRIFSDAVIDFYLLNPFRFSSEYYDSSLGLICYNYRHYNSGDGRWVKFDAVGELGGINLFYFLYNNPIADVDVLGLRLKPEKDGRVRRYYEQVSKGVGKSSFRETYNLAAYEKAYSKFEETINEAKLFGTIDEREAVFQENELRKCCPGLRDSVLRYAHKKQEK